jgi:hypothetical protein
VVVLRGLMAIDFFVAGSSDTYVLSGEESEEMKGHQLTIVKAQVIKTSFSLTVSPSAAAFAT